MRATGRAAAVAATGVGLGVLVAAGRKLSRAASWRSRRMWKMTARGATRYAGTKARQLVTPAERRAALDEQFAIRTAEDVAKELGEMKGVLMKIGQLISFIVEAGSATFTIGEETVELGAGQIAVVPAGTPHKFVSGQAFRLISITPADHMTQEDLE